MTTSTKIKTTSKIKRKKRKICKKQNKMINFSSNENNEVRGILKKISGTKQNIKKIETDRVLQVLYCTERCLCYLTKTK